MVLVDPIDETAKATDSTDAKRSLLEESDTVPTAAIDYFVCSKDHNVVDTDMATDKVTSLDSIRAKSVAITATAEAKVRSNDS